MICNGEVFTVVLTSIPVAYLSQSRRVLFRMFEKWGEGSGGAVRRWKGRRWNGNGGEWGTDIEGAGVEEEEEVVLETDV